MYDVVIMGGGVGGNMQARHLLRTIPGIKIAMVDPRSDSKIESIHKIGESTVEIAAFFLSQELGLVDYLLENHLPKCGLAFHWPREAGKTGTIGDYHSIWPTRFPKVMSYQLHRGKLERDLLQMNIDDGLTFIRGRVKDFEIGEGDAPHTVIVKQAAAGEPRLELKAPYLVDAAGRAMLTGNKFDNILRDPSHRYGLDTFTSWVRVSGVDRTLFEEAAGASRCATSNYYVTNHFMGHGHWLWLIPICAETGTVSVGGMFHKEIFGENPLDREEKLSAFLKANHEVLFKLVDSGDNVDFIHWPNPSHQSKRMFSQDRWYALGDAAFFGDAFYSLGISTVAVAVSSITEIIRARMAGEPDAAEKTEAYNDFNLEFGMTAMSLYRDHVHHLGNASAMSWRIYLEYMWWFGLWVPAFIGKWHLDVDMCRTIRRNSEAPFFKSVYDDLTTMIRSGKHVGFMDPYRADQLAFGYCPTHEHVEFLDNSQFDPSRLDIFRSLSRTYLWTAVVLVVFAKKAFGWSALLEPRNLRRVAYLVFKGSYIYLGSLQHRFRNRRKVRSEDLAAATAGFEGYGGEAPLLPWATEEAE